MLVLVSKKYKEEKKYCDKFLSKSLICRVGICAFENSDNLLNNELDGTLFRENVVLLLKFTCLSLFDFLDFLQHTGPHHNAVVSELILPFITPNKHSNEA